MKDPDRIYGISGLGLPNGENLAGLVNPARFLYD
jgi:hypothetical protein